MSKATTIGGPAAPAVPEEHIDPKKAIAFLAMVFGMFMAILDIQIVSASLAEIQAGLSASSDEISWVQTSYLIAEVIMIPLSGFLGRLVSTRILFSVSAAGFTAASILCATATNIDQMIVYRAIQGFIGGGMIPSVFAAAFTIFPPSKRNIVSPMIGLVATLAPTIGPTVGGYLSNAFSWHWLFLVNVIPGIAVAIAAWNLIDFDKGDRSLLNKFDWWGLAAMAAFLGSLEYVLEEGPRNDWLQDNAVYYCSIVMVIGGLTFFYRAFTAEQPIVDLYAFKNLNFAFGSAFSFVLGIGLYGLTYIYPVYLGQIRGYDALMIGEALFVSGLCMFLTAPVAGFLSGRVDPRLMIMTGFIGFARRHLDHDEPDRRLGFQRTSGSADLTRCLADALHGADQQSGAWHPAACTAEECLRSVQPHAQPWRRCRTGCDQSDPDRSRRPPLCTALRECPLGQSGGGGYDGDDE